MNKYNLKGGVAEEYLTYKQQTTPKYNEQQQLTNPNFINLEQKIEQTNKPLAVTEPKPTDTKSVAVTESKQKLGEEQLSFYLTNYLFIDNHNQLQQILTPQVNLEKMFEDIFEKLKGDDDTVKIQIDDTHDEKRSKRSDSSNSLMDFDVECHNDTKTNK